MRVFIGLCLALMLTACGQGLSESKVRSLVQDHWHRHGSGVPLGDLPFICMARTHDSTGRVTGGGGLSRQCSEAAECIAPIVGDLPPDVTWEERGLAFPIHRGNNPMLSAEHYYPAFEATIIRVVEVTDNVAEGLSPTENASGTAKLQVRLTLSRHARAVQDCPGLADLLHATDQPVTMSASLVGRQVNRGGGVQIEWSIDDVIAWDRDQPAPPTTEDRVPTAFNANLSCTLNADASVGTPATSEITLNLTGDLCVNDHTLYTKTNNAGEFRRVVIDNYVGTLDVLTINTEVGAFRRDRYPLTPSDLELANDEVAAAGLSEGCSANDGDAGLGRRNERLLRFANGEPQQRLVYECRVER